MSCHLFLFPAFEMDCFWWHIADFALVMAQILIRWAIQHGTSALPKSVTPGRIEKNLHVFEWKLSAEDFKKLSSFPDQVGTGRPRANPDRACAAA